MNKGYRAYLLGLLTVILAFNFLDRVALGIVLQDIKGDLDLSDTQIGLLTGIAFTIFYATMGIPIARWADRGNRITIISLTTALWSAAVALSALAMNFFQLMAIRFGAAVGEAGCVPPAHSLIADYYSREERPRAVAIYMLGGPIALTIGYLAAGWLNQLYGWRTTFLILGLPGLAVALLARFSLKEPRFAEAAGAKAVSGEPAPPVTAVVHSLWTNRSFRHLAFAFAIWGFFGNGILQWLPTFFIRSYHLGTGELGTWLAAIYGIGGGIGVYLGGEWATRFAAGKERRQLAFCAIGFILCAVFYAGTYVAPNKVLAFASLGIALFGINMVQGPILATMQTLVNAHMRALSIALTYLFANLIGVGLGPLAAGALSDALAPSFGADSLKYALLVFCPGFFWAAWHCWHARVSVTADLEASAAASAAHGALVDEGGAPRSGAA